MKSVVLKSIGLALAVAVTAASAANAADWPDRPVRIVVPVAAGGAADRLIRTFAQALSTTIGQQFVVENRGGGGGIPAIESVVHAKPDGYTLLLSGLPYLVLTRP
jgi:tripartite-type tricarboxylate transporter receptor subunit TctC